MFKKLWKWIKSLFGKSGSGSSGVSYSDFPYDFGGFNGKNAKEVSSAVISGLSVSRAGQGKLAYLWNKGGCEDLGASSRTDAGATVCCLFCQGKDGKWHGGKFDWISTSRLTRGLENCHGYNGWSYGYVQNAQRFAFVIVSKDGRRRTNVVFS